MDVRQEVENEDYTAKWNVASESAQDVRRNGKLVSSNGPRDLRIKRAISLVEGQQYEAAILLLKSIISSDKENEFPKKALGVCYIKTGRLSLAKKIFIEIFKKNRRSFDAANNLGAIYHNTSDFANARSWFHTAVDLKPNDVLARYNLANAQMSLLDYQSAEQEFQKCLAINPNAKPVLKNLGALYLKIGRFEEAIEVFKKILVFHVNDAPSHNSLATAYSAIDENRLAKLEYQNCLKLDPENPEYLVNFSIFLKDIGLVKEALSYAERAEVARPDDKKIDKALASILRSLGAREAATSYLLKLVETYPDDFGHLRLLSVAAPESFGEDKTKEIEEVFSKTNDLDARCQIGNALFGIYESKKKYDLAFRYLKSGNDAEKNKRRYSLQTDLEYFERVRQMNDRIAALEPFPSEMSGPAPIFILGMPRSGTSILEQILSVKGDCAGLGELSYVRKFVERELLNNPSDIKAKNLLEFRNYYLTRIVDLMEARGEKRPYFVDKMPHNFLFIGLLAAALPEAKFIHVYRDPAATCWSNFTRYFPAPGLSYSFDLKDIVEYYDLYREFMSDVSATSIGNKIYHLSYEKLTEDLRGSTQSLMRYLGFEWQEDMLKPHLNTRAVRTASSLQVKKPIYRGSSEAWRKYEASVGGYLGALRPFEVTSH